LRDLRILFWTTTEKLLLRSLGDNGIEQTVFIVTTCFFEKCWNSRAVDTPTLYKYNI
jgi:hypothetical protein